jgi:Fic family protein
MRENLPWKWEKLPLQITALLSGKRVAAPKREIDEVEGAHRAYAKVATFNAYSVQDLLKAHGLMTQGLVKRPGEFRKCAVGVVNAAGDVVHLAPRSELVPGLMDELLAWLSDSDEPMLVKSCVFHWCFENIHPFPDGNGRMGRLWQMVLLGSWNPLFYAAPIENIVWTHQAEYYAAIRAVEENGGNIRPFIEFMLDKILRTLKAKGEAYGTESREKSREKSRDKVLKLLKKQPDLTQAELSEALGLSVKAIEKVIRQLRDANQIRREGGKKFGHWELV